MKIDKIIKQNTKGFTLIEVMIYFALLSIILLIISDLFFRISEASLESTSKSRVEIEGEYVLDRIAYDIHRIDTSRGDLILLPANPGDSTPWLVTRIDGTVYVHVSLGQEISYGKLFILADRLTSNSVKAPNTTFTRFENPGGKPTIQINFTLESTTPTKTGVESKDFETVVSVR